jgi:tetratricopeptide (TPR) repeat protein
MDANLPRETTLMELILGAYQIAAGNEQLALETYARASARARNSDIPALAAQAELALGALHLRSGNTDEAVSAYLRAGTFAREAALPLVAIEALRIAGQIRLDAGAESDAVKHWSDALAIAEALPTHEARASSAGEVARALTALLRKRGQAAQARVFEDRSRELEGGAA